jgi:hypothetical protein
MESPREKGPPDVGWRTRCNVLHNRSYTRGREQCATGLTSVDPADVSQVVDRMTPWEFCADATGGSSSWATLGADCRARSYKMPCVVARTGWVERKLTAKEWLLAWDLPAMTIKNASVVVGKRLSQEKVLPFKVRIHVAAAIRVAMMEGTKGAFL